MMPPLHRDWGVSDETLIYTYLAIFTLWVCMTNGMLCVAYIRSRRQKIKVKELELEIERLKAINDKKEQFDSTYPKNTNENDETQFLEHEIQTNKKITQTKN